MTSETDETTLPRIEEIFVAAVQAALETGHILGLSHDQFMATLKVAWFVDQERRNKEEGKSK